LKTKNSGQLKGDKGPAATHKSSRSEELAIGRGIFEITHSLESIGARVVGDKTGKPFGGPVGVVTKFTLGLQLHLRLGMISSSLEAFEGDDTLVAANVGAESPTIIESTQETDMFASGNV